jgi:hypothetical protein
MRRCWVLFFVVLGLAVLGCGKGDDMPPLHPVKGKVVHKGQPVRGGRVELHPVNDQGLIFVNAEVGNDGTFTLITRKGSRSAPGAPEGSYHVLYLPPLAAGPGDQADPAKAQALKPSQFPTPFKVEARTNELTLDLARAKK